MAQKTKVKELVGRGLNSYHTKFLQQIDRIEKKNKEQNHKISILSNELDNDYLTKTEEGSVISLEHSKEGMVYLDELQGNTLVNYCADGSKEMTLNGDIDVEGTFVTLTEGVDNGKVDVMCEGNTLVNLVNKIQDYKGNAYLYGWQNTPSNCEKYEWVDNGVKIYSTLQDTSTDRYFRSTPYENGIFKPNRTYIVRMNVSASDLNVSASILRCFYGNGKVFMSGSLQDVENGVFVKKATTSSDLNVPHSMISLDYTRALNTEGWVSFQNVIVIDVTDLPSYQQDIEYWRNMNYFEGMKSVGQDDENGHKIEILSQNKNLIHTVRNYNNTLDRGVTMTMENNNTLHLNGTTTNANGDLDYTLHNSEQMDVYLKPNRNYIVNFEVVSGSVSPIPSNAIKITDLVTGKVEWRTVKDGNRVIKSSVNPRKVSWIRLAYTQVTTFDNYKYRVQIEEGNTTTSYVKGLCNKKEILLNEPLRGLPNGVKDRFIKQGSKWYVERNCGEVVLDGSEEWGTKEVFDTVIRYRCTLPNNNAKHSDKNAISDKYITTHGDEPFIHLRVSNGWVWYYTSEDLTYEEVKNVFRNTPAKLVYQLATPTYEEITDVELMTYLDTTHIYNNSTIPCNMKIKNTGYNAIIKPSTLYTVALDTNKNGTIGMNLGGAKITTTNNVATITTPATLSDDSLRLYGKDIKSSKVRLLEGDKTNWIPSFFEGMKSSFEDKFDVTDNTYKMEILSNDISLFDLHNRNFYIDKTQGASNLTVNGRKIEYDANGNYKYLRYDRFNFVRGKKYTIVIKGNNSRVLYYNNNNLSATGITSDNIKSVTFIAGHNAYTSGIENGERGACKVTIEDVWIYEGDYDESKHITTKSNKIQFSSIEPLRSVNKNIRDKFIFKDGKLMIERNCVQRVMENKNWSLNKTVESTKAIQFTNGVMMKSIGAYAKSQEVLCNKKPTLQNDGGKNSIWVYDYQTLVMQMDNNLIKTREDFGDWIENENPIITLPLKEPIYEEIPFELQKIILEGYENGTLFFDTNIPPTSTVTYAGETPIVKSVRLNKTEVLNNTNDINDNIVPYLMDMDYRVVCLQLQSENTNNGVSMARLFGGAYEMLKRDIQSKRYSVDEYKHRLDAYLDANKITEEEYNKLGDMLNE